MTGLVEGAATMPALLRARSAADPGRPALRAKARGIWHTRTWGQVVEDAEQLAAGLGKCAVGERIAVLAPLGAPAWVAGLAVHLMGGSLVRLPHDSEPSTLAELLGATLPRTVLVQDQELLDRLLDVLAGDDVPQVDRIVVLDGGAPDLQGRAISAGSLRRAGADHQRADPALVRCWGDAVEPGHEGCVLFSGGTGGVVRAVGLTHADLIGAARRLGAALGAAPAGDLLVQSGPADPTAQHLIVGAAAVAALVVDLPEHEGTVDTDRREVAPTVLAMPARGWARLHADLTDGIDLGRRPSALRALRARVLRKQAGLGRLRAALSYGGHPAPGTVAFFAGLGVPLADLYGTVDTGPLAVTTRGATTPTLLVPEQSLTIVDGELQWRDPETGTSVPTGDTGVLEGTRWTPGDPRTCAGHAGDPAHVIAARIEQSAFVTAALVEWTAPAELVAHVSLDLRGLERWAAVEGLDRRSYGALAAEPRVLALLAEEIRAAEDRAAVPAAHRVTRIRVHPGPFRSRTGELTQDGRVRPGALGVATSPVHGAAVLATEGSPV